MRGRRPIPRELRAGGQPPPATLSPEELPPCPDWVDPDAKAMWARLAPELCALGLLSSATLEAFAAYCQCWSQWKYATELVRAQGLTIATGRGMTRLNPAASYAKDMATQMRGYAAEFGLTPASRARAGAPVATGEDDAALDEFLSEGVTQVPLNPN